MRNRIGILLGMMLAWISTAWAYDATDTMTGIMHPAFRTLQVHPVDPSGAIYEGPAVMTLGANDYIVISFDELAEERNYLRYELIHCNALWVPDGLVDSEFLDGFNQANVDEYEFSHGTLAHYVHYNIVLPNNDMRPLISGNYLLRVYPEDDPDLTVVQARFSVTEKSARTYADVTSRTDFDYNGSHQQLTIKVDTDRLRLNDVYNDIKIVVDQDGRNDNAVVITHPLSVVGRTAEYSHNPSLTFDAGNEYRRFEVINDYYPGMGVESIVYADPFYHHTLYVDTPRDDKSYLYDLARKGRYVVRRQNATDGNTEADYVVVHFALESPELSGYDIYIEGDLTDRRLNPESRMVYNHDTGMYEKALFLKQGAYSYQYVALPRNKQSRGLTGPVEGDFYQTQHDYTIRVYYRAPGERYDRLASVLTVNTSNM